MQLCCVDCRSTYPPKLLYSCAQCGGILTVLEPPGAPLVDRLRSRDQIAGKNTGCFLSLGEGSTPLQLAEGLKNAIPGFRGELWLKNETVNPTGSFKDRLICAAINKARELGSTGLVCASSGNAGASASAYAALAGMPAVIIVPSHAPPEKLTQIAAYGPILVTVDGHYSDTYRVAGEFAERVGFANVTTTYINPYGTNALKLIACELLEQLAGQVPDYVVVPTGAGPLVMGVIEGFRHISPRYVPKVIVVQAEGCMPIVRAFQRGDSEVKAWGEPLTIASGISDALVGYERDGTYTLRVLRESAGLAVGVDDDLIRDAMKLIARCEGVLAEPTAASSVAAVIKLMAESRIPAKSRIVCLVTGHGFKDFGTFREMSYPILKNEDGGIEQVIEAVVKAKHGRAPDLS